MTVTTRRSRAFHFIAALLGTGLFLLLVGILPSLATASDPQIIVKCAVEIAFALVLLAALLRWGEPPELLGVRRLHASTLGWGLLCFLVIAVLSAATLFAFARFGIGQDKATLTALASRSVPIILLIAATAAIAEEIVFRSVLITELEAATGLKWLAALVSLAIFAGAHAAGWGPSQVIFAAVPGLVLTLAFLWKRNLWICILAHFLTDAAGLLAAAAGMAHHP
jgi:uncharacterized protein